ncbi:receptor-like protein 18 [Camellia sinensis]|uniref:receptor-like protein 18 n=1 Tax=Camellia sinensis TaxID=4442 RepID=UPI0010358D80|nr:receptor-like protein 18 [Camellia sinensis]
MKERCAYWLKSGSESHEKLNKALLVTSQITISLDPFHMGSNSTHSRTIPTRGIQDCEETLYQGNVQSNNFRGPIPHLYNKGNTLKVVDFSGNQLQGKLVVLTKLQVLILRSNKFYGAIGSFEKLVLPNLRIIDLSHNGFTGDLPQEIQREDSKSIGNLKGLKGLQLLNLSNNDLTEGIPSCLGNLINLESLNLSQNKLSGKIPHQLALLTFLEFLNLSNNHLIGPIPNGKQFNTFENNSYEGNLGLCGDRLSRKCGKSKAQPPSPPLNSEQDNDSTFSSTVDWIAYAWDMLVG